MEEIWKKVERYDGYEVSNLGNVRSLRRGKPKVLAPAPQSKGYLSVFLAVLPMGQGARGAQKSECVHVLVLEAFKGPCPEGQQARHLDGDQRNNHVDNLSWGTGRQQMEDQKRHGRLLLGEKNHKAKLTSENVAQIRARLQAGEKATRLAEEFGVSCPTISDIRYNVTWNDDPNTFARDRDDARPKKVKKESSDGGASGVCS